MNIDVLREMVRLAENRRAEELEAIERLNKYNIALIAFSGSFLSLIVSIDFPKITVEVTGFFLLFSIILSLASVRPRTLRGGSLTIDTDIQALKNGEILSYPQYLLVVAELTDIAATRINKRNGEKRKFTIISATLLACALISTYTLYVYAQTS